MNLWENDIFNNQNILYLFNHYITEYDMKNAGFSLIQDLKLLPQKTIDELSKMKKHDRDIKIGKLQRNDKKFSNDLKYGFQLARKTFIESNRLTEDDILCIKKDAIFTIRECDNTKFGDNIEFRDKNKYTSFITLKPIKSSRILQLFYNKSKLDVKGIGDIELENHEDYMCKFIKDYFKMMEDSTSEYTLQYLRTFADNYKMLRLDIPYYREFNSQSRYLMKNGETSNIEYMDKEELDIMYNYINIISKLILITI